MTKRVTLHVNARRIIDFTLTAAVAKVVSGATTPWWATLLIGAGAPVVLDAAVLLLLVATALTVRGLNHLTRKAHR